jgi:multidrug efflux pump subunit AcrA (membrane-fusion protein)
VCPKAHAAETAPPTVATSLAVAGSVTPTQSRAGVVAPYQNVAIQSTLTEPTDSVPVQEGDHVRAGQLLAQLDTSDLQANMNADLASASADAVNTSHLQFSGVLSITQGTNGVSSAQAALTQAKKSSPTTAPTSLAISSCMQTAISPSRCFKTNKRWSQMTSRPYATTKHRSTARSRRW